MVSTMRRGWRIRSQSLGQQVDVPAQRLAHAALDAVALVRLAQHLARREADARDRLRGCRASSAVCGARNQLIDADCRLRAAA